MAKPVEERVKEIIVEQLGVEEDEVLPAAKFIEDLGADSLDTVELVMAFEEEFGAALIQGKSGIGPITRFDASPLPTKIAGELKGFDPLRYMDKKDDRKFDPFLKYAIACAAMAVEDAGLNVERVDRTRFGVLVGSGIGGITTLLETHKILLEKGPDRVSPFFIPMLIVNMASGLISMRFGARGPNSSIVTACATGNHAIGDAM